MTPVSIEMPFPPSVNGLFGGITRRRITKHYRTWRNEAEKMILISRARPMAGPVKIAIKLHPPDSRARDASNFIKAIEDALVRMRVIPDDSAEHVQGVTAEWGPVAKPSKRARAIVTITPLTTEVGQQPKGG